MRNQPAATCFSEDGSATKSRFPYPFWIRIIQILFLLFSFFRCVLTANPFKAPLLYLIAFIFVKNKNELSHINVAGIFYNLQAEVIKVFKALECNILGHYHNKNGECCWCCLTISSNTKGLKSNHQ